MLKTTLLLTGLTLVFIFAGGALAGEAGMKTAFFLACIMNLGSYWFSDKIVLSMYRAEEALEHNEPELYNLVRGLASRAGLPMPRVYIIPDQTPNAFATGRNPEHAAVAATRGILGILSMEELKAVLAHELAHVRNRDILLSTVAATIAGAISMLANMAQWGMFMGGRGRDEHEGGSPLGAIAMMVLAPMAAMLIQMAISRSREYLADETGARINGNPLPLARALEKLQQGVMRMPPAEPNPATAHMFIVNPLSGEGLMGLFSTHPPIEERVARLEEMARAR